MFYSIPPRPLSDNAVTYKSEKPRNIGRNDQVILKCDCIVGSFVNGIRERTLLSFSLDKPHGHKICKNSRSKLLKKN